MNKYKEIQKYVKQKYGFIPKTCWIAHSKEICGITVRKAWNRRGNVRKYSCPNDKLPAIKDALKHFGMI